MPGTPAERLTMLLDSPVRELDPRFIVDSQSANVSRLVFASLMSVDNPQTELRGDLATEVAPDPSAVDAAGRVSRWRVTLRPDARFHDGRPLTARDVVFTYRSILDPALRSPIRSGFSRKIQAVRPDPSDPLRVWFDLVEPYATFPSDLVTGIVPDGAAVGTTVGAGPFRLVQRLGGRKLVLARHAQYHGGPPPIPYLVFRVIPDENTRLLALLGGSADVVQNGLTPTLLDVVAADRRLRVVAARSVAWTYLVFNLRHPQLADVRVRRALALAVDRADVIRRKYRGYAEPSTSMLNDLSWGFEPALENPPFDLAAADGALTAAGFPRDARTGRRTLGLTLKVSDHRFRRSVGRDLARQWQRLGLDVTLVSHELGTFLHDVRTGNFDLALLKLPEPTEPDMLRWMFYSRNAPDLFPRPSGSPYARLDRRFWVPGLDRLLVGEPRCAAWARAELGSGLLRWLHARGRGAPPSEGSNRSFFADARVDCLLMRAWGEAMQPDTRAPLYREAQRRIAAALPVLPLWHEHNVAVLSERVADFDLLPNGRLAALARARLVSTGVRAAAR